MTEVNPEVTVSFECLPGVNYALYQNHVPVIRQLSIKNNSLTEWSSLTILITALDDFAEPLKIQADRVLPDEIFEPENVQLKLKPAFISSLTERMASLLKLIVKVEEEEIYCAEFEIDLLAYDQWLGSSILPEMLSAFVTPNLPDLNPILKSAAEILGKWTEDSALNAYQSQNPDRVKKQMAAVYTAISKNEITYCTVPASFGGIGQRIRLADSVLQTGMGNCLDMSLLYASCLEAIGLHPLLILIKGHAFVGAWLIDDTFPDAVNDDHSLLTKRMAFGINEVLLIESTEMNEGRNTLFDNAVESARNHFINTDDFDHFIDVHRSRFSGIRPLPLRRNNEGEWEIIEEKARNDENGDTVQSPESLQDGLKLRHIAQVNYEKQQLWERKLLDLSLRNNLLNLRITRSSLQFIPVPLNELEDAMSSGDEFQILAKPKDWENTFRNAGIYQSVNSQDPIAHLVKEELKQKRLRVYLTEEELREGLIGLFRNARKAMEENGANTLYLAIGLLRWYETNTSERPRFAPILLMPVELIRKSVKKGFIIRTREEETVLNITLLEKLRQDYGINLTGLNPLPTDESGVDVKSVFNLVRQAVMSQARWDVEEQIFLATFSFSKFIMWNDIHSNAEKIKENPVVSGLMRGHLSEPFPVVNEEDLDESYGYEDIMLPINADSSQLQAICSAARGDSFILHGPPGTGKSQTITNIIANALYKGKRVLFVAEKMAALTVVQSRLNAIGLAPFCLELHSNKAKKSEVLAQMQRTSAVVRRKPPEDFQLEADQLNQLRRTLNQYVLALHKKQKHGYSLYDLFNEYAEIRDAETFRFPIEILKEAEREKITNWFDTVERLQTSAVLCGEANQRHPLYGIMLHKFNNQIKEKIATALIEFITIRKELNKYLTETLSLLKIYDSDWDDEKLRAYIKLTDHILGLPKIPDPFFLEEKTLTLETDLLPLLSFGEQCDVLRKELLADFQSTILSAPANELLSNWNKANAKWFLPRYFEQKKIRTHLYGYLKSGKLTKNQIPKILLKTIDFQEKKATLDEHSDYLKGMLGNMWKNGRPDWKSMEEAVRAIKTLDKMCSQWNRDSLRTNSLRKTIGQIVSADILVKGKSLELLQSLIDRANQEKGVRTHTEQILGIQLPFILENGEDHFYLKAKQWAENISGLKDWFNWTQIRHQAISEGLEALIKGYEEEQITVSSSLLDSFKKTIFAELAELIIEDEPLLATFNGHSFETQIKKYSELLKNFTQLTQSTLFAQLAARIPVFAQEAASSSETGILQRAIKSNGRGLSLRQLFNAIPNLLPRMYPCMLMSPISVAQYLDINNSAFDVVIFDEASQMPTSEAVGAIARGKSLIVVGDPKQMPPTNFFSSVNFDEEDSNEDLESILDDCQALSVPSRQLSWHYRSQHESLIAFSNAKYYDNSLFTFPSPDDLATRVHFVPINGTYDRGKTRQNQAEARAIVQEIVRLLMLPEEDRKSIGVVTFSSVQQSLIEDMLNEEFLRNPALEEIDDKSLEPLFVKNLENVQGDERDIILFSICYGPDETGHVSLNFGPLNRNGGWRRLNVAVSRARYLMKIYSTLRSDQINLSRTRSEGVAGLKAFLAFAEKGRTALPIKTSSTMSQASATMESSLADFLKRQGYKVDTNIGCSGYRIDMAVVNPKRTAEYLLAILFDGQNYSSSRSARDRNVGQLSVLKALGWQTFRIWSLDWWENQEKIKQSLIQYIENLLSSNEEVMPKAPTSLPTSVSIEKEDNPKEENATGSQNFATTSTYNSNVATNEVEYLTDSLESVGPETVADNIYRITQLQTLHKVSYEDFLDYSRTGILMQQVRQVIDTEAPINQSLLCRRILSAWGISRMGSRIQNRFEQVFAAMKLNTTKGLGDNFCFWKEGQDPSEFTNYRLPGKENERRDAEDLPIAEVANAVGEILNSQISMPEDDLVRETAKVFQYARVGGNVDAAMRSGIGEAIDRKIARREDGRIVFSRDIQF